MQRSATAVWNGDLKAGSGHLTTGSKVLAQQLYNFVSRFEDGSATNPEELLGAAHAGCFSMALVAGLGRAGIPVQTVTTEAKVTLETVEGKPTITRIDLHAHAVAPGADRAQIQEIAEGTKTGCVVSRALASVPMFLTTQIDV